MRTDSQILKKRLTDHPTPHHINPCNQILTIMKYGVNRVTLVGNVGEVPRVTEREGEAFVANFPLATNEVWRDKEGEEVRRTEWHRVVVWNKAADIVKQYVKKGDALYVEGKISTNSWDDSEGNKHYSTEIVCDNFLFLSPRNNGEPIES
jgi:single-strand DNA-binding protein